MRIGGIASGMDTEQMVKDLMRAERVRVDKYFRQEEALKWKRDALNTTNKTLAEFILKARSGFGLSTTTSTGSVLNKTASSFDWVKKATSSNESAVKVTATTDAMPGSHTIQVHQLADVARMTSNKINDMLENGGSRFKEENYGSFKIETVNGTATINIEDTKVEGKVPTNLNFEGDKPFVLTVNGKSVELKENFNSMGELEVHLEAFKDELSEIGVILSFENGKLNFTSKNDIVINSSDNTSLEGLGLENKIYKAPNSITSIVNQINNSVDSVTGKGLGLRAAYDTNLGKLMITTKEQGETQTIKINSIDSNTLVSNIFGENSEVVTTGVSGKNTEFWFNETNPTSENMISQNSNNFSMYGINFQLQSAKPGEVISVNVESNVDGIVDKVKGFVEDYNKLIDEINSKLKEKSYRDYQPLTKEEREAMKDKEIELWEEKAKSGLLRNDETLTRVLQTMRDGLYKNVEGLEGGFTHITQIGITTGNYQSGGKLEVNEEKLRSAIADNPDGVIDLLFKKSDTKVIDGDKETLNKNRAESGLVERLFNDMITGMKEVVRRSGTGEDASLFRNVQSNMLIDFVTSGSISVLDRDLMNIGTRIANEERILIGRENRYWAQFTAMEKALERMNQQSGWLQSQLGQMG